MDGARRRRRLMLAPWPLTGRSAELERLGRLYRDGSCGGVVLTGPAGVGKTRLAEEALRLAERAGRRVERAVGHPSTQAIPLGALAHVLPADLVRDLGVGDDERTALFHAARAELGRLSVDGRLVLLVDDLDLLDDTSVAVLVPLVVARSVFLIGTVRTGRSPSPRLTGLYRDGHLVRLDLEPLEPDELDALLHRALDGPVTAAAFAELARLSGGNLQVLTELVRGARERGALTQVGGAWDLTAPLPTTAALDELVAEHLAGVDAAGLAVLEVLAVCERFGLADLERVHGAATLEALEASRLVAVVTSGRRTAVRLAHPLYGEVLRAGLAPLRLRRIYAQLADIVEAHGARRREDVVQVALWRVASGGVVPGESLLRRPGSRSPAAMRPLPFGSSTRVSDDDEGVGAGDRAEVLVEAHCPPGRRRRGRAVRRRGLGRAAQRRTPGPPRPAARRHPLLPPARPRRRARRARDGAGPAHRPGGDRRRRCAAGHAAGRRRTAGRGAADRRLDRRPATRSDPGRAGGGAGDQPAHARSLRRGGRPRSPGRRRSRRPARVARPARHRPAPAQRGPRARLLRPLREARELLEPAVGPGADHERDGRLGVVRDGPRRDRPRHRSRPGGDPPVPERRRRGQRGGSGRGAGVGARRRRPGSPAGRRVRTGGGRPPAAPTRWRARSRRRWPPASARGRGSTPAVGICRPPLDRIRGVAEQVRRDQLHIFEQGVLHDLVRFGAAGRGGRASRRARRGSSTVRSCRSTPPTPGPPSIATSRCSPHVVDRYEAIDVLGLAAEAAAELAELYRAGSEARLAAAAAYRSANLADRAGELRTPALARGQRSRAAHAARTRGRAAGRGGPHQSRHRRAPRPLDENRRHPPRPRVPQAGDRRSDRARRRPRVLILIVST